MATCVEQRTPIEKPAAAGALASVRRKLSTIRSEQTRFGCGASLRMLANRIGRRLLKLKIVHVVWLDVGDVAVSAASYPDFTFRFLSAGEVASFADDPDYDLEPEMANRAADGRNSCFAALDGDRLAAYGWYARDWIEPEHCDGFGLQMPPEVAYMYKGFTHPDYRGKRLHGAVMGFALRDFAADGVQSLISTVDWTNDASLKSCARLGYRRLGLLARARALGRAWWHASRKARERGVEIVPPGSANVGKLTIV